MDHTRRDTKQSKHLSYEHKGNIAQERGHLGGPEDCGEHLQQETGGTEGDAYRDQKTSGEVEQQQCGAVTVDMIHYHFYVLLPTSVHGNYKNKI